MQPKIAGTAQERKSPTAPPVYHPQVTVIQRAAEQKKKPGKGAHTTKAGKIKASSIAWLKDLPKNTKPSDVIDLWETHHSMLDDFARIDAQGLPPGTAGNLPQFVDLRALTADYYVLGNMLTQAVAAANTPANSRGDHDNAEGKLPTYPAAAAVPMAAAAAAGAAAAAVAAAPAAVAAAPYEEFGFFKGGGRLVVDHRSVPNRQYISLHYSTFYRIA